MREEKEVEYEFGGTNTGLNEKEGVKFWQKSEREEELGCGLRDVRKEEGERKGVVIERYS